RRVAVLRPDLAAVEAGEPLSPRIHVGETTEPDEPVGCVEVLELAEDADAHRLLRLDELPLEERDQGLSLAGMKCVLPELDDGAGNHPGNTARSLVLCSRPDEDRRGRPETNARQPASPGGPQDVRAAARADRPGAPGAHSRRRGTTGNPAAVLADARRRAGRGAHHRAPGAGGAPGRGLSRRGAPLGSARPPGAARGGIHPGSGPDRARGLAAAALHRRPGAGGARHRRTAPRPGASSLSTGAPGAGPLPDRALVQAGRPGAVAGE